MPITYELVWYMVNLEAPDTVRFNVAIRGVKFGAEDVQPQGIDMSAPISEVASSPGSGKFDADDIVEWVKSKKGQVITRAKRPPETRAQ